MLNKLTPCSLGHLGSKRDLNLSSDLKDLKRESFFVAWRDNRR